jgi:transposase
MSYYNRFIRLAKNHEKIAKANYLIVVKDYTQEQAAKEIGVSSKTIARWVKANFTRSNRRFENDEVKPVAKFLLYRGYSNNEIATILSISNTTVANWIKEYEWKEREPKYIDKGGDLAILCWSFMEYIQANDKVTFFAVMQLIKKYRDETVNL